MSDDPRSLEPRLHAAATALSQRRTGKSYPDILDTLTDAAFAIDVEDARAILAAADAIPSLPEPRRVRDLTAFDAAALGLDLGARATIILARGANGHITAAQWAGGGGPSDLITGRHLQVLWGVARRTLSPGQES